MPDLHSDASQTPDRAASCSGAQRTALAAIVAAAEDGGSFAALTGEAATGKTAVLDMAAALLDHPPIQVIRVDAGGQPLTSQRLIVAIAGDGAGRDHEAAIERALDRLLMPAPPRRRTILMVDDAHALERDALAYLSLTSGMVGDDIAPLQIVFAGRPSFWPLLECDPMGRLCQRIRYRATLDDPVRPANSAVAVLPGRGALRELMVLRPARRRTVRYALGSGVAASLLVASMVPMGRDAAPPRRAPAGAPVAPRLAPASRPAAVVSVAAKLAAASVPAAVRPNAPKPAAQLRPAAGIAPTVVPAVARTPARPATPASQAARMATAQVTNATAVAGSGGETRPPAISAPIARPIVMQVASVPAPDRPPAPKPVARPHPVRSVAPAAPTLGPDGGLLAAAGLASARVQPQPELLGWIVTPPPKAPAAPVVASAPPRTVPTAVAIARPPPARSPAPAPASLAPAPAVAPLPAPVVAALLSRGDEMLRLGDIGAARLLYERAAASGSGEAALAMGRTHDPRVLARIGAQGIAPDPAAAAAWYRRAAALGDREAGGLLAGLETMAAQ